MNYRKVGSGGPEESKEVILYGGKGFTSKLEEHKVGGLFFNISYGSKNYYTPFSIKLRDFQLERYPGSMSPSSFAAEVTVKDGKVNDHHYCKLEIGIHGKYYSQRNTYQWKDENGKVTKEEVYEFPGEFDRSGYVRIVSPKIAGWGKVVDSVDEGDGTIVFYGVYNAPPFPDTFDLIRLFDKTGSRRFRTWQVKLKDDLFV